MGFNRKTAPSGMLEIHLAVALFGLSGLFGKWIALPALAIVFGRVFFAFLALALVIKRLGIPFLLREKQDYWKMGALGLLLAVHWLTFFGSIRQSSVAVGLLTFSTFPVFTALLEPLFFRADRLHWKDFALALAALGGVALVIPEWDPRDMGFQGAMLGVVSGATFALLTILNRALVSAYSSIQIAFYQDSTAALILLVPFLLLSPIPSLNQLLLLMVLGTVFTAFSHALFIHGMRHVPARSASLIATLEPIYGIAAASLFLSETLTITTGIGGSVILGVAVYETFRRR